MLAATIRVTGDIDVAEECVQEAYARALTHWTRQGVPSKPGAWLTTVARRRAIDLLRRRSVDQRAVARLAVHDPGDVPSGAHYPAIEDDRLRLIFTCCHPALSSEAQVALTLRLLCGLTTPEVARAFLVSESTMAARLTRAKKKIKVSRVPYRVPDVEDLPTRIDAVLSVIHLLFTTGHTAPSGAELVRSDLVERALDLGRLLHTLLPNDSGVLGLRALIVLTDARRETRTNAEGALTLLADQDRLRWDQRAIREGVELVRAARASGTEHRFVLMAAIAAEHATAPSWEETNWRAIVELYDALELAWPSPVVSLNRCVALGLAEGPAVGLIALEALEALEGDELLGYNYFASTRADFLRRLGRRDEACAAYEVALALTQNEVERGFLQGRLDELAT